MPQSSRLSSDVVGVFFFFFFSQRNKLEGRKEIKRTPSRIVIRRLLKSFLFVEISNQSTHVHNYHVYCNFTTYAQSRREVDKINRADNDRYSTDCGPWPSVQWSVAFFSISLDTSNKFVVQIYLKLQKVSQLWGKKLSTCVEVKRNLGKSIRVWVNDRYRIFHSKYWKNVVIFWTSSNRMRILTWFHRGRATSWWKISIVTDGSDKFFCFCSDLRDFLSLVNANSKFFSPCITCICRNVSLILTTRDRIYRKIGVSYKLV